MMNNEIIVEASNKIRTLQKNFKKSKKDGGKGIK